jgi:hypothetical protein
MGIAALKLSQRRPPIWMRALLATLICLGVTTLPGHASMVKLTAKTLFDLCAGDPRSQQYSDCRDYMTAYLSEARLNATSGVGTTICVGSDVTGDMAASAFVHISRAREDFLIGSADRAVQSALEIAFPCSRRPAGWAPAGSSRRSQSTSAPEIGSMQTSLSLTPRAPAVSAIA